jgi:hypothetical protein
MVGGIRRPFLRVEREGVELFRCTRCLGWKKRELYRKNQSTRWGITSICKVCLRKSEARRLETNGDRIRARSRDRYAMARRLELEGEERERRGGSYGNLRVRISLVRPWLLRLFELEGTWTLVGERLHIDGTRASKIAQGTYDSDSIPLEIAERLAGELNLEQELWDTIIVPGKEGWGPHGERFCVRCGTYERPYHADSMCRRCYAVKAYHRAKGQPTPPPKTERWASWWEHCWRCETRDRPHMGFGLCSKCYLQIYHAARKVGKSVEQFIVDFPSLRP